MGAPEPTHPFQTRTGCECHAGFALAVAQVPAQEERLDVLRDVRSFVAEEPAREGAGLHFAISQVRVLDYIDSKLAALSPSRVQRALDYLDAVDRLDNDAARRISGLPLYSASPEFRSALMNVLAHGAAPPEYPGLALVPQSDLERLRSLAGALGVETKEEGS